MILIGIVAFFIVGVIFDLVQVFITLLLVFFNIVGITTSGKSIAELALLVFAIWTKIFLELTQSLP